MKREYKGFYIEPSNDEYFPWRAYHVVTGNLGGAFKSIKETKDAIDCIHESAEEYARYAGVEVKELVPKRGRWVTSRLTVK